MKLDWEMILWVFGEAWRCVIATTFVLRLEPRREDATFAVAVLSGQYGGAPLYRSNRRYPLEEAKHQAIVEGARVARRLAKTHTEIADLLKLAGQPGGAR